MKRVTLFLTACVVAVIALLAANIRAQQPDTNDRTFMTFSSAVELPGVTLEPGTYEFRLASNDSRNVVQVLKKDDSKVMGQWTFVPAERERASGDTIVMFKEAPEGSTPAVQYWYYPGQRVGKEFIYPKDQAQRIATRTGQSVRTDDGAVKAETARAAADPSLTPAPSTEARSADSSSELNANRESASASSDSALRNGPAAAQPTAPAGSLTGNRGITQADASAPVSTDNAPSASASADTSLRNAPAPAQPTAAAGSLTGSRGAVGTSGSSDAAASRSAQADRPVGTSGVAEAQAPQTPASSSQAARPAAELPKTASALPLSGLIGLLSLVAAVSLRSLRA
jgi:hypothetical protein